MQCTYVPTYQCAFEKTHKHDDRRRRRRCRLWSAIRWKIDFCRLATLSTIPAHNRWRYWTGQWLEWKRTSTMFWILYSSRVWFENHWVFVSYFDFDVLSNFNGAHKQFAEHNSSPLSIYRIVCTMYACNIGCLQLFNPLWSYGGA